MKKNVEIQEFLLSRREKIQPEEVGLPRGTRRRVPGLRREEVATLAGVSVDYYVQIERGEAAGVSDEVLAALARALRLETAEKEHLFNLVRNEVAARSVQPAIVRIPPALRQILDSMVLAPAIIMTAELDIVAFNALGKALFRPIFELQEKPNFARYVFLNEDSRRFYEDWDGVADDVAAMLRLALSQTPSKALQALIEELTEGSDAFNRRWEAHDVKNHHRGSKIMHDASVGELHLYYEILEMPGTPGVRLVGYTPNHDYPQTEQALKLLSSLFASESSMTRAL